jgi:hypothetical protein
MATLVKYDCIDNAVELQEYTKYFAGIDYPSEFYVNLFNFLTDSDLDYNIVHPDSVLDQVRYRRLKSEFEADKKRYPEIFNKDKTSAVRATELMLKGLRDKIEGFIENEKTSISQFLINHPDLDVRILSRRMGRLLIIAPYFDNVN